MKIALQHLDARGLAVDLPGTRNERVVVTEAKGLRGILIQGPTGLNLTDVHATQVGLEALRVVLGSVTLSGEAGATLSEVILSLSKDATGLSLEMAADLDATVLCVETPTLTVRGKARFQGARLRVQGGEGRLTAARATLEGVEFRMKGVTARAPDLRWDGFVLGWGEVFRLEGARLEATALTVGMPQVALEGREVAVEGFALADGDVSFVGLALGRAEVHVDLKKAEADAAEPDAAEADAAETDAHGLAPGGLPLFDLRLLDGISGRVRADVTVDVSVPVIGSRRATHRLRVPLEAGSLDYMALENNLSPLENSILDFAVRDTGLVLERGLPLLPTRGRGKPIVIWDLDGDDLALARSQRVRLAVLPRGRLARNGADASDDEHQDESNGNGNASSIALRHLTVGDLDVSLTLAPPAVPLPAALPYLQFESLTLHGEVSHDPGLEPPPGALQGSLKALAGRLQGLRLGSRQLAVEGLALAAAESVSVEFAGLRPIDVRAALVGLAIQGLGLTADREPDAAPPT